MFSDAVIQEAGRRILEAAAAIAWAHTLIED